MFIHNCIPSTRLAAASVCALVAIRVFVLTFCLVFFFLSDSLTIFAGFPCNTSFCSSTSCLSTSAVFPLADFFSDFTFNYAIDIRGFIPSSILVKIMLVLVRKFIIKDLSCFPPQNFPSIKKKISPLSMKVELGNFNHISNSKLNLFK